MKDANGCVFNINSTVGLQNDLTLAVGPVDTTICPGGSFTPRVQSNATSYSWTPSVGLSSPTVASPLITAANFDVTYTLTATLGNCSAQGSVSLSVLPALNISAGPYQVIIAGDQVQLQGSAPQGTYLWSPASGLSASNVLTPVATPQTTTTYTLTVTDQQGCTGSDDVTVVVEPYCIAPMEVFTPNGDGINDRWLITNGSCMKTAKVEIFNRYGSKVYESPNYSNDWDGTYKGKPLPDGTYYFVITYQLINQKSVFLKGNVAILR